MQCNYGIYTIYVKEYLITHDLPNVDINRISLRYVLSSCGAHYEKVNNNFLRVYETKLTSEVIKSGNVFRLFRKPCKSEFCIFSFFLQNVKYFFKSARMFNAIPRYLYHSSDTTLWAK